MADIITAIKNDPNFCVTVLGTFLAFIGILCAADLKTSKGIKVAVSAGIVCAAIIGVTIIYFTIIKKPPDPPQPPTSTSAVLESPTPTPAPAQTPTPAPSTQPPKSVPSEADLAGCDERLQFPSSYLRDYETKVVKSHSGNGVYLRLAPTSLRIRICTIPDDTEVRVIAEENGYSLAIVADGLAGWITSDRLVDK